MGQGSVLFLCTGNAARSVIAGAALARRRPELDIVTAGTLVIDGLPLSLRTQTALEAVGLDCPGHRSKQVGIDHLDQAKLVVAMAPEHTHWVRRNQPDFSERTITLIHLVRQADHHSGPIDHWISAAGLNGHEPNPDEEIVDPGGGEVDGYIIAARRIVELIDRIADRF